jgi:alpha-beta hydrolase superfamily lysophospholipase
MSATEKRDTIRTNDGVTIFFKDWGSGQPVVFSHGWPLSSDDWDAQMLFFLQHGYRVIAHDRRGHGRSSQTADGHDMDHYADDLAARPAPMRVPASRTSTKIVPNNPGARAQPTGFERPTNNFPVAGYG